MQNKRLSIRFVLQLIFILGTAGVLQGQFGASISYDRQFAERWETLFAASDSLASAEQHFALSLNYWFRLKNKRIEFLPEITLRRNFGNSTENSLVGYTHSLDAKLNAHVYLFDLGSDCNCPTFSKQGNFLQKGFYIAAIVGGSWRQYVLKSPDLTESGGTVSSDSFLGLAGFGSGIDIGISDLVTITPWVNYEWHFGARWDQLSTYSPESVDLEKQSPVNYLRFGIRLLFRPDYKPFR